MADPFAIEPLDHEAPGPFLELLSAYLGPGAPLRYRWFYLGNPHGRARTFVARHLPSGRLVGCASLFPRRVAFGGTEVLAALAGDAYVLPEMRRRGLAQRLHVAAMAALLDPGPGGLSFMFGPPEPDNLRVLRRVGSRGVRTLRTFTCPLRGEWVRRFAGGVLAGQVLEGALRVLGMRFVLQRRRPLLPVERVDARFEDLWQRARPRQVVVPVRDVAYLQWRFLGAPRRRVRLLGLPAPSGEGRLSGYAAVEPGEGRLVVHDLLAEGPADVVALALGLKELGRQGGMEAITLRLDQGGPYLAALLWAGFLPSPKTESLQLLAMRSECEIVRRGEELPWLFSLGDEDWTGS